MVPPDISSGDAPTEHGIRPEDELPPRIAGCKRFVLFIADATGITAGGIVLLFCWLLLSNPDAVPTCICWFYFASSVGISALIIDRLIRHKRLVHEARVEDRSEVEAFIQEVKHVEPRLQSPERPAEFEKRRKNLDDEVDRLEKQLGPRAWTEYQVLPLDQMLVDFLKVDDLIARAKSLLAELDDYARDSAYRYDLELYISWQNRIDNAIKKIEQSEEQGRESSKEQPKSLNGQNMELVKDDASESLRAELRSLQEHVVSYQKSWAEGSTVVRSVIICGIVALGLALIAGIVPAVYPGHGKALGVFSWGLIGISGALTAVLWPIYKSNRVEVGNTEGLGEVKRAGLAAIFGMLAGILAYCAIAGELFGPGAIVAPIKNGTLKNMGLSVVDAFIAGFLFERVFHRVRKADISGREQ